MPVNMIHAVQNAGPDTGRLKISVTSSIGLIPVTDATVKISYKEIGRASCRERV